jgi:hypothetical protein
MSKRDQALLAAAGLTVTAAAKILGRTRQAIYSGMSAASDDKPYFTGQEARWVWQDAKQRDSRQLDQLMQFVAANFPKSESDLILEYQVGYNQVQRVIAEGEEVIVAFNGNLEELDPNSTFAKILSDLLGSDQPPRLLLPGDWVASYIEERLKLKAPPYVVRDELTYLPSFVAIRLKESYRAFFFQRFSPEECKVNVAEGLWMHFSPMSSDHAARKSRAVG